MYNKLLDKENILFNNQIEFCAGHSTQHALLELTKHETYSTTKVFC